jgi:predicted nucleic acid-binding protein
MIYVDSNVFLYAYLDSEQKGDAARAVLESFADDTVMTSALTYDEVSWKLLQHLERDTALEAIETFLHLPFVSFAAVNKSIITTAHEHIQDGIGPRDAIHAAHAKHNDTSILSEDTDFDTTDLNRVSIREYAAGMEDVS